ncbi:MAG: hypothetical protein HY231_27405 [Acidobacteria bacterium]|nr:hypothetical protein [Acidobacteriota bacterium]
MLWLAAALLITACLMRYWQAPSFWLDEAFVAASLRYPTIHTIFAPLENKQFFPRLYLLAIAGLRELFGYRIWVLRVLPFLCFIAASLMWARLLIKKAGNDLVIGLLGAALMLGAFAWMDEGIQLKQYTFDVMFALIPFCLSDDFFKEVLVGGKHKSRAIYLAIPCALSYTYPIALMARLLGWYWQPGKRQGWRLHKPTVFALGAAITLGFVSIWFTDYQYNMNDQSVYLSYWSHCILRSRFQEGGLSGLRLLADFFWGWHQGRLMPLVIAVIAPLQLLGIYQVLSRGRATNASAEDSAWGSRSRGSLILLTSVILAGWVVNYPICAGRLTLFVQIHLQILTLEGAVFILRLSHAGSIAKLLLYLCVGIITLFSAHRYISFVRDESPENLRPLVSLIKPDLSETLWVHSCSVIQVQTWPDPLPVQNVWFSKKKEVPEPGQKVWLIWTHLGDDYCRESLEKLRSRALSWQVIDEGRGRGLALAQF